MATKIYGIEQTFVVHLNQANDMQLRSCFPFEVDNDDGIALNVEENRFYRAILDDLGEEIDNGLVEDKSNDVLYVNIYYSDPDCTHEIARFSISENEVIRYLLSEHNGVDRIVSGERCSTRTAMNIGEWIHPATGKNEYLVRERLFKKRSGQFFCEYAVQHRQFCPMWDYVGTELVDVNGARVWTQEHASEMFDAFFGDVEDNNSTVLISAIIRVDTKSKIDRLKSMSNESVGQLVDRLVAKEYDRVLEEDE